jgi:crotonobetainyl-CoA:carnitine CoA-transferase CaiB-like acyl-CoA transferase
MEAPSQGIETLDGRIEVGWQNPKDPMAGPKLLEWLGIRDEVYEKYPQMTGKPITQGDTAAMRPYIAREFKKHTSIELIEKLLDLGLMFAPVHDLGTYYADPGILEQDVVRTVVHPTRGTLREVSPAWQLDGAPAEIVLGPPTLGEHTDVVLRELGYDAPRIAALRSRNVVR